MSQYRVAVVGATGAVGTVMLQKLRERGFPAEQIVPFASERSAGKQLDGVTIRALNDDTIQGFDIALFSAGATTNTSASSANSRPTTFLNASPETGSEASTRILLPISPPYPGSRRIPRSG